MRRIKLHWLVLAALLTAGLSATAVQAQSRKPVKPSSTSLYRDHDSHLGEYRYHYRRDWTRCHFGPYREWRQSGGYYHSWVDRDGNHRLSWVDRGSSSTRKRR
jgi:hypothetical protein